MKKRVLSFVVMVAIFLGTLGGTVFAAGENDMQLNLQGIDRGLSTQDIELNAAHRIFKDVQDSDWFYNFVDYAYYYGLFKGTSDNTFSPNGTMTRAMFVTVIFRIFNYDGRFTGIGEDIFSDVISGNYYYDAVSFCFGYQLIDGVGDGKFAPNSPVTRQEAATIIGRIFDTREITIPHVSYSDSSSINSWALNHVDLMAFYKLMEGYPDGSFRPLNNMSRGECAKVLSYLHSGLNFEE